MLAFLKVFELVGLVTLAFIEVAQSAGALPSSLPALKCSTFCWGGQSRGAYCKESGAQQGELHIGMKIKR